MCRYDEPSLPNNNEAKNVSKPDLSLASANSLPGMRKLKAEDDQLERDVASVEDVADQVTTNASGYRPSNIHHLAELVKVCLLNIQDV